MAVVTGTVGGDPTECGWYVSSSTTNTKTYFFEPSDQVQVGQTYTVTYMELPEPKTCEGGTPNCTGGSVISAVHG